MQMFRLMFLQVPYDHGQVRTGRQGIRQRRVRVGIELKETTIGGRGRSCGIGGGGGISRGVGGGSCPWGRCWPQRGGRLRTTAHIQGGIEEEADFVAPSVIVARDVEQRRFRVGKGTVVVGPVYVEKNRVVQTLVSVVFIITPISVIIADDVDRSGTGERVLVEAWAEVHGRRCEYM